MIGIEFDDLWIRGQLIKAGKQMGLQVKQRTANEMVLKGRKMVDKIREGKSQYIEKLKKKLEESLKKTPSDSKDRLEILELLY